MLSWSVLATETTAPGSKVHVPNMGPIWGREDPGGPHVGPIHLAIWGILVVWNDMIMSSGNVAINMQTLYCYKTFNVRVSLLGNSYAYNLHNTYHMTYTLMSPKGFLLIHLRCVCYVYYL